MRVPRSVYFAVLGLMLLPAGMIHAAPPANPPAASTPLPDYGGRDSGVPAAVGEAAPDPAASAGRAVEALVLVLAGVAGVVYLLKRFHLVQAGADGKPARIAAPVFGRSPGGRSPVSVVSSQALPGGAMLHVVRVGERTLLLAATAQSVTNLTEWDTPDTDAASLSDGFEEYLTRADPDHTASRVAAANARLRSLLSPRPPEEPS